MAYEMYGAKPKPNAPKPYVVDCAQMIAKMDREFAERPAREAALVAAMKEFALSYGSASVITLAEQIINWR